jgi:hypothetical protein
VKCLVCISSSDISRGFPFYWVICVKGLRGTPALWRTKFEQTRRLDRMLACDSARLQASSRSLLKDMLSNAVNVYGALVLPFLTFYIEYKH